MDTLESSHILCLVNTTLYAQYSRILHGVAYVQSTRITTTRVVVSVNQLELGFTEEWEFLLANDSLNLNSTEFFFFARPRNPA